MGSRETKQRTPWTAAAGAALAALLLFVLLSTGKPDPAPAAESATDVAQPGEASAPGSDRTRAARSTATVASAKTERTADAGAEATSPVIAAGWGAGLFELGRDRPQEGNPEAPMSLALGANGTTLVLDQVNGRIVRYGADGTPTDTMQVTLQAPQDLVVAKDGTTLVLDRLVDKSVAVMDANGKLLGELPVEGKGIEEGGGVTGVFVDGEDVYVEKEHGPLVKVGDTSGRPDPERPELPGRPTRDGLSYLLAAIVDPMEGRLAITSITRETQEHRFTRDLRMGAPALGILLLDTDRQGVIYLAALLEQIELEPRKDGRPNVRVRLVCLEPTQGQPIGTAELPPNTMAEETFRDFAVLDEGGVVYALRTEQGVTYQRYMCQ